jgi:hypothetical protein
MLLLMLIILDAAADAASNRFAATADANDPCNVSALPHTLLVMLRCDRQPRGLRPHVPVHPRHDVHTHVCIVRTPSPTLRLLYGRSDARFASAVCYPLRF